MDILMGLNFDDTPLRDPLGKREGKQQGPRGGNKYTRPRGYVSPPGSGPKGETCGTCKHCVHERRWKKCELARNMWTGGRATDILARAPACAKWEKLLTPKRS